MMRSILERRSVIGLFTLEDKAADALDALNASGFSDGEYEVLTGTPYPCLLYTSDAADE